MNGVQLDLIELRKLDDCIEEAKKEGREYLQFVLHNAVYYDMKQLKGFRFKR